MPGPEPVSRAVATAFYRALGEGDIGTLAQFLADDVRWTVNGPVDVLQFCGTRIGKCAVIDFLAHLRPDVFMAYRFVPETLLVDGDRVAALVRLSGRRKEDGRAISYRAGQFLQFRDRKIISYLSIIDSFDAAEQMLGHRLAFADDDSHRADSGDLVAV